MAKWTMQDIVEKTKNGPCEISADTGLRVDAPIIPTKVKSPHTCLLVQR